MTVHSEKDPPEYVSLRTIGTVLVTLAILLYAAAVLSGIFALAMGAMNLMQIAISAVITGVVLHAIGALCAAIRDIARNSFRR